MIADTLWDYNGTTLFAFVVDLTKPAGSRVLWQTEVKGWNRSIFEEQAIHVLSVDNRLLRINRSTGVIEKKYPLLWEPNYFIIRDSTAYIFSGRTVYAMHLRGETL